MLRACDSRNGTTPSSTEGTNTGRAPTVRRPTAVAPSLASRFSRAS